MSERCRWCGDDPIYVQYHDTEWGVPTYDDQSLFQSLVLEGAQAGLSWITVLRKRDGYRSAFANFDFEAIAAFSDRQLMDLRTDERIIRNRLKIESARTNAIAFIETRKEFGSFSEFIWGFVNDRPIVNSWNEHQSIPASTELSERISKNLKKRGFKFVGSTIVYSFLQACGLVNDHVTSCFRYEECKAMAK
tara:strand:+ start:322 stop:897 length:576 start_codon:yes stop_codon:yes gene_type:complete